MNMLEKMAWAIAATNAAPGEIKVLAVRHPTELDREKARAALEALLEPGDDILFAGAAESRVDEGGYQEAKVVFRAMIQAALDGK